MAKVNEFFTEEQNKAATLRGHSLIVSAAAGSGKTSVLAERVVDFIMNGGSFDRLLVVTFTKAAAAEMRSRIAKKLKIKLEESPKNRHLHEQSIRIHSAAICTIDSFLMELIRDNCSSLGISPIFSVYGSSEFRIIFAKTLREVIDECYEQYPDGFEELTALFGGDGENEKLDEAIENLYYATESLPFPEKWFEKSIHSYNDISEWLIAACREYEPLFSELDRVFTDLTGKLDNKKNNALEYDTKFVRLALECCRRDDWDGLCDAVSSYNRLDYRANSSKPDEVRFKAYRNTLNEDILRNKDNKQKIFRIKIADAKADAARQKPAVAALFNIVTEIRRRMKEESARVGKYSFAELSRIACSLLVTDYNAENGAYTPSSIANGLKRSFDEILIDEYQDVNDSQNMIFEAISNNNLFVVGDSKQSIYAFRGSNPENFSRMRSSVEEIDLNKNFRSRDGILDFCNFAFSRLFSNYTGGLEYGKEESLVCGADYQNRVECETEIDLLHTEKTDFAVQPVFVANRINGLLQDFTVKDNDGVRPARPSDIAILVRNNSDVDAYVSALDELAIPAFAATSGSYLTTREVSTVLEFLKTIENPYLDMSLFISLTSPLFNFSAEEMAKIRLSEKSGRLFSALKIYAEEDPHSEQFLTTHERFVLLSQNLSVHELIWEIYIREGYLDKISLTDIGTQARDNLMKLYSFALNYDNSIGGGLAEFNDYASVASEKADKETDGASPDGEYVRVMTMHASKGLEFPICFVCGTEKALYRASDSLVTDIKLGAAMKIRDVDGTYETTTLMREIALLRKRRMELSENLRLLYVAATRAREKLIITGDVPKTTLKEITEFPLRDDGNRVGSCFILSSSSFLKYILYAVSQHPDAAHIFGTDGKEAHGNLKLTLIDRVEHFVLYKCGEAPSTGLDEAELTRRLDYEYPHKVSLIPAKISVTELVKGFMPDEDSLPLFAPADTEAIPEFMQKSTLSGARRGTAIHRFMRYADLSMSAKDAKKALFEKGLMTEEELDCIDENAVEALRASELFGMISGCDKLHREKEFVISVPVGLYDTRLSDSTDTLLLQGAIDALCEYSDGLVLIDYKSDRFVTEDALRQRYTAQLGYYRLASEKMFGKTVKKAYIWSFELKKAIELCV